MHPMSLDPMPSPTAHLHALADVLVSVLKTVARDEAHVDDLLNDPLLMVTLSAPARAYACGRAATVFGVVDIATLPAALASAIGAFVEGCFEQMDEPDRRAAYEAIQRGAEPVVTFRPLTGHAKLLLHGDGRPVELVRLVAAEPVTH
jgi:hypothetical protein